MLVERPHTLYSAGTPLLHSAHASQAAALAVGTNLQAGQFMSRAIEQWLLTMAYLFTPNPTLHSHLDDPRGMPCPWQCPQHAS